MKNIIFCKKHNIKILITENTPHKSCVKCFQGNKDKYRQKNFIAKEYSYKTEV